MTGNGTAELLRLDSAGFLPAPGESREEFILRSEEIIRVHREFDEYIEREGSADIFDFVTVKNSDRNWSMMWRGILGNFMVLRCGMCPDFI